MSEQDAPKVLNHDVAGVYARVNRFIYELVKSVSSGVSQVNEFDQKRLASYLSALKEYVGWIDAQPHLDLPETHPRVISLEPYPLVPDLENESVNDIVRLFVIARDELTNSQSSRQSSGLVGFDKERFLAVVEKVDAFLSTYIANITPLDLPESSPMEEMSGHGRTGI